MKRCKRKFARRLDAARTEVIYVDFDFGPDKSVTGKLGVAAGVGDTPYIRHSRRRRTRE